MVRDAVISFRFFLQSLILLFALVGISGCVSSSDALRLETAANCPLMQYLQDNDEDIFQVEDGIGAIGEATACPT